MRSPAAPLLAQMLANETAPQHLVAIDGWGGSVVRWASVGVDVSWDGHTWDGRPFTVGGLTWGQEGQAISCDVEVDDADLAVTKLCIANDPRELAVTVYRLFRNLASSLAVVDADPVGTLELGGVALRTATVAFSLHAFRKASSARVPGLYYDRPCARVYADPDTGFNQCVYASACDHTWQSCRDTYAYTANYGGIPILGRRRYA